MVLGERCSGTTMVESLFPNDFPICHRNTDLTKLYWKHAHPDQLPWSAYERLFVVVVFRNAYDWIPSFHRWHWHIQASKSRLEFIKSPIIPIVKSKVESFFIPKDIHPSGRYYHNPLEMRTEKYNAYIALKFKQPYVKFIRLEDKLSHQEEFIKDLQSYFGHDLLSAKMKVRSYGKSKVVSSSYNLSVVEKYEIRTRLSWKLENKLEYRY